MAKVTIDTDTLTISQLQTLIDLSPLYNDEEVLKKLFHALVKSMKKEDFLFKGYEHEGYVPPSDLNYRVLTVKIDDDASVTLSYNLTYKFYFLSTSYSLQ